MLVPRTGKNTCISYAQNPHLCINSKHAHEWTTWTSLIQPQWCQPIALHDADSPQSLHPLRGINAPQVCSIFLQKRDHLQEKCQGYLVKGGGEFQLIPLENRKKVFSDLGSGAAMTPLFSCAVWASLSPHYTHSELRKGGISSCNNECFPKGHHMTIIPYFGRSTFITL